MLLNGEVDPKVANAIILACNTMLAVIKQDEGINDCENGGNSTMKNSRQYKIQGRSKWEETDMVKKKPAAQAKTAENETVKVETKAAEKTTAAEKEAVKEVWERIK